MFHMQVVKRWRTACSTAGGRALLDSWDCQGRDVDDVTEGLLHLAASYSHDEEEELGI